MIVGRTGFVAKGLYVAGLAWSPVYVVVGERGLYLFEAGFYCMGRYYERDIIGAGKGLAPTHLFLTHVHYDHCGAVTHLKRVFSRLTVAASGRAAEIIGRPNARNLMERLSRNVVRLIEPMEGVDPALLIRESFEPFGIDRVVEDGQTIFLEDGLSVKVIATPGHTRDMMSYYLPERKILVATEAVGCLGHSNQIVTEFLVDYDGYVKALQRLSALDIEVLCQGHHFVFVGEDVKPYLERSLKAAREFKEAVEGHLLARAGSVDEVVEIVKTREYDTNKGVKQPEQAYLINLRTRVAHLAERMKGEGRLP